MISGRNERGASAAYRCPILSEGIWATSAASKKGRHCASLRRHCTEYSTVMHALVSSLMGIFGHSLYLFYDTPGPDKSSFALIMACAMSSMDVRLYIDCSLINL
jgi:hypothetical protein